MLSSRIHAQPHVLARAFLAAGLCILLTTPSAIAQVLYGSLVGAVTDPDRAAVAKATITVTNTMTGQKRKVETNETGFYSFSTLPSGSYEVDCTVPGFARFFQTGVSVAINNVTRVDVRLELGTVTASVQVGADLSLLQTDRAEVRKQVDSTTLSSLPIPNGRNYQQLFVMLPGFSPPENQHTVGANPSRALGFNVNGTSRSSNNIRVDGASVNGIWLPHIASYIPNLESIAEVNAVTNSFDAEQGLAGGVAVNVQIKSGTNALHGSAFEFHNNNNTQAKPFFLPTGQQNPKLILNQFGGTIGGPMKRDKLFYFVSYEGIIERQLGASFQTVPTAQIRRGDMSASTLLIYDPSTGTASGGGRTAFPGNIVPLSRQEPIVHKLVNLTPLPNLDDRLVNNYYATGSYVFNRNTIDSKLNWNVNDTLTLYGRLSYLRFLIDNPAIFGELGGTGVYTPAGRPGITDGSTLSMSLGGTYVITPNLILDANLGMNFPEVYNDTVRQDENLGLEFLGIPGTNGPRRIQGGWPGFAVNSYSFIGSTGTAEPLLWRDRAYQYIANVNYTNGSHSFRSGVDISKQNLNHVTHELSGSPRGNFTFAGGPTALQGGPAPNQFNNYAAFLLGLPTQIQKTLQVPDLVTTRAKLISLYARDQWQLSRRLTLSYGVRWEYFPLPTRADYGMATFDVDNNTMRLCGFGVVPSGCDIEMSKRLFAPRVGFAFRPSDSLVVRAGYGITIDPYSLARPLRTNYPELVGYSETGPNSFQPANLLRNGIPPLVSPQLGNGIIPVPIAVVAFGLPKQFDRGYIQSWNFTVQKQLKWGFNGEAGYVATRQIKQMGFQELNAGTVNGGLASRPLYQRYGRAISTRFVGPVGNGTYDSLQTSLQRGFRGGYQVQVSYTWSKALGVGADASDGIVPIKIPEYFHLNRSVTGYHRPHNLQISSIVELPFGKGKPLLNSGGFVSRIFAGWRINSLLSCYSGTYFSVTSSGTSLNAPESSQRADQVKKDVEIIGNTGPGQSFFDPFAFAAVTEPRFGTAGFRSVMGPGVINLDFGLFREFRFNERVDVQFRAESYNLTNTPHFANPGTNVSNLQLNPDRSIRNLGGYTEITSTIDRARDGTDQRAVRFALRITF